MTEVLERVREALLPRYELGPEIGSGGMAVIHRASVSGEGRIVAIKVLRADVARFLGVDRFLREISILRALDHPGIVSLLDAGTAAGIPWLVMPFIAGPTLRDAIAGAPAGLPLARVLDVARDVAAAIDYAHRQGIMHRDIKPENILLPEGRAIVTDFGLARAVEAAASDELSSSGLVLGTAAYMSPEQADPALVVDERTDIYALGCVLYEMATGEPPFTGASTHAVIARHTAERPAAVRVVRPDLPPRFDRALQAALAKSPGERPATAAALVAALES